MVGTDARQSVRALGRQPLFAAGVVGTLALGMGGVTAVFSVMDAALLRPLPYASAERLVEAWQALPGGTIDARVDRAMWEEWRDQAGVFEGLELQSTAVRLVTGRGEPRSVTAAELTPGVFDLLGVAPLLGRVFTAQEARTGGPSIALVSESLWRERWDGGPVIGDVIAVDGMAHEIIGVMPESFRYPRNGRASLYVPLRDTVAEAVLVGRLRNGLSVDAAKAEISAIAARLAQERPREKSWDLYLWPLADRALAGQAETTLWLLCGAVLGVLLIGCVNVANLMLVRATARVRELAIRGVLGATRGRLVRMLLIESMILSAAACGAGLSLAYAGVQLYTAIAPATLTRFQSGPIHIDARVLGFALGLGVITGLLFGVLPALVASRNRTPLSGGERAATGSRTVRRTRAALAIAELSLAMTLLVSATLLIRSLMTQLRYDHGYDVDSTLVLDLWLPSHGYPDPPARRAFFDRTVERLGALPGVERVAEGDLAPPASGFAIGLQLHAEGQPAPERALELVPIARVDDAYFDVLGIELLDGRPFGPGDVAGGPRVAMIDTDLAQRLWPGERAVGRRFRTRESGDWLEVVGVVASVRMLGVPQLRSPQCRSLGCNVEIYLSLHQSEARAQHAIVLRTAGDPAALAAAVRSAVWELDPTIPLPWVHTGRERVRGLLDEQRFVLNLIATFTVLAVLLAAVGVHAVLAYAVARRTREIGVRVALGATPRSVMADVMQASLGYAAAGIAFGVMGAIVSARLIESLLVGIVPTDPLAIVCAALLLGGIALLAALAPARRALRVNPLEALRLE